MNAEKPNKKDQGSEPVFDGHLTDEYSSTCEATESTVHLLECLVAAAKRQGHDPALVLLHNKKAFQTNWPNLRPTVSEARDHICKNPRQNAIGVQPASVGCVVLDCDEGDGPKTAAEVIEEQNGDVVVCVTPSSSGRADRGHVWINCDNPDSVGNWQFKINDPIYDVSGDLRSSQGQVRLTDTAMKILVDSFDRLDGLKVAASVFNQMRTSMASETDGDFDPSSGHEVTDEIAESLSQLVNGPADVPRYKHLFAIAGHLKRSGVSFDSALEYLSEHVPNWPDEDGHDDGKFDGPRLERHLYRAWSKLDPYVAASEDFDDEPSLVSQTSGVMMPTKTRSTFEIELKVKNNRAVDTYKNARAGIFAQGLRPAYNELKQSVTFLGEINWPESYGRELTEHTLRMVRDLLVEAYPEVDFQPSKDNVYEAIMSMSYMNKYHPVTDYLDDISWDGTSRCQELFIKGFPCMEDARYLRECGIRFMVSAAARARIPGCKVDTMPVVCGPQGSLKSTGVRVLFGADWLSDAAIPDLKSKDAAIVLRGIWCHEYAELAGMSNQDVATLKAFLSRPVDTYRAPYGRTAEDHPRRCVFFGTVNESGYLRDSTGGRRFWPMEMSAGSRVDVDWIAANRDQLWAEADALLSSGERWWLEDEAWSLALDRAAEETVEDPWTATLEEYLETRLEPVFDDEKPVLSANRVFTKELLEALGLGTGKARPAESKRLRLVMEKEIGGWRYRRKLRVGGETYSGYYRIDADENAGFHGH